MVTPFLNLKRLLLIFALQHAIACSVLAENRPQPVPVPPGPYWLLLAWYTPDRITNFHVPIFQIFFFCIHEITLGNVYYNDT